MKCVQSVAFSASHTDFGRDDALELSMKSATPQAPRALFSLGPDHIFHSLPQMKCKQGCHQPCTGPGQGTPHTHHTCFRQQQCHSPAQHLLRSQKPPYAISLSKLTREVRKWCPRSTRRPHDNSQKLQTDPAGHGLRGFPCATPLHCVRAGVQEE